jgi:hypothetical protein
MYIWFDYPYAAQNSFPIRATGEFSSDDIGSRCRQLMRALREKRFVQPKPTLAI